MEWKIVNTLLINAIALWKKFKASNPDAPAMTDAQVIEMLEGDAEASRARGQAWLDSHPAE